MAVIVSVIKYLSPIWSLSLVGSRRLSSIGDYFEHERGRIQVERGRTTPALAGERHTGAGSGSEVEHGLRIGRAGAIGGARQLSLIPCRQRRIDAGSVSAAIKRIGPPQSGHTLTSIRNTRASSFAHDSRWRPGGPSPALAWPEQSFAVSDSVAVPGTIRDRSAACGASTPW